MAQDEPTFGYDPEEASARAFHAVHGFATLASSMDSEAHLEFTLATSESIEQTRAKPPEEHLELVSANRQVFEQHFCQANFPLVRPDARRIWQLLMERYDFATHQLRPNLADIIECINPEVLTDQFQKPLAYFARLPPSSELAVGRWTEGIRLELVIPTRLLLLDLILMLVHARSEHRALEASFDETTRIRSNCGRLDSYARQVIILAASVCDNVLTEYGYCVEVVSEVDGTGEEKCSRLKQVHKQGVYDRLTDAPKAWRAALGLNPVEPPALISDMRALVTIRNRLVHPDGRVNGWYAFQLDPNNMRGLTFTTRFESYAQEPVSYRVPNSNVGYEWCLAKFCVDTVLAVIDYLHSTAFPGEDRATWVDLPMQDGSRLDVDAAVSKEPVLQSNAG